MWNDWAQKKGFPLYVEPEYDLFSGILEKENENVRLWLNDSVGIDRISLLKCASDLEKIDADFVLGCLVGIKKDSGWVSEIDMKKILEKEQDIKEKFKLVVSDLPYWNRDLHDLGFGKRRKLLETFYTQHLSKIDEVELISSREVNSKGDLFSEISSVCKKDGSNGAAVKFSDGKYSLSGVTNDQGKIKNVIEIKAKVISLQKDRSGMHSYNVGVGRGLSNFINICGQDDTLLDVGRTLSTRILAKEDDIITLEIDKIISCNDEFKCLNSKVIDIDSSSSLAKEYVVEQILDMASRSSVLQKVTSLADHSEEAYNFWKNHWFESYPKSGKGKFVYQHHWVGLSKEESEMSEEELLMTNRDVHGDLRFEIDGGLIGWTVLLGTASNLGGGQDLTELEKSQPSGRDLYVDKFIKMEDAKSTQCLPKILEPLKMLTVAHDVPFVGKPGDPDSTSKAYSKFFEVDSGTYDMGVWHERLFEFFLHGNRLDGRALVQFGPVASSNAHSWFISMPLEQKPYMDACNKEDVMSELRSSGQTYLVWAKPDTIPELIRVSTKVRFFKEDRKKQIVYGVAIEPNTVDLQSEWISAEDIEEAAHDYLSLYGDKKLSHKEYIDAKIVESYIAPCSFRPDNSNEIILKGSWVVGMKVVSPSL
ncbi:hypothetical protein KKH23_10575, partial [Patescibacteria group bacterium]|nr:hypothetical protein [Patescibacteria group bacterium]